MATNSELLTSGFRITRNALVPYVISELKVWYEDDWWTKGVYDIIFDDHKSDYPISGEEEVLTEKLDLLLTLKVIDQNWHQFKRKLPREYKSWVNEVLAARNKWAHLGQNDFTNNSTARILETMALLCQPINSEAEINLQKLVRTARYGNEKGSIGVVPKKVVVKVKKNSNGQNLKSWRDVLAPHPDVAEGRYKKAEFAADLSQVASGKASYEYMDPVEFFGRTYITTGMENLIIQALERITGRGGEPVVELKTAFGGGKTHTMLALYHMLGGKVSCDSIPILKPIVEKAGLTNIPRANIAVLVGTALDKASSRRPSDMPGVTINTLWGEMTYQLAKSAKDPSLYDIIKESDKKGINPGSDVLTTLFDKCGPTMILLDELVAYGRDLYGKTNLPAGTYENFLSFIQSLTEAACSSPRCILVASIPQSDIEVGGEIGQKVLDTLSHYFGRKEAIWKPVESNEGFEVVRRRLFGVCTDRAARDATCEAFFKMYRDNPQEFPVECRTEEYLARMKQCYPIHPEVFDRLYDDWATLEKFQKTRGVLRLMAAVINNLWLSGDTDYMILPSSLPISAPFVKEELLRYLSDSWNAIVDNEVDGDKSIPVLLEAQNPVFGQLQAPRKVTRTLFFGSAPSEGTKNRGIEKSHILLGCAEPDDTLHVYNDALTILLTKLSYLYDSPGYNRYWFDVRPTLRKLMEDRANRISNEIAYDYINDLLHNIRKGNCFRTVHIAPEKTLDIPDEKETRLVVLGPLDVYSIDEGDSSPAIIKIKNILDRRGTGPRLYKNTLVFCFADRKSIYALLPEAKKYLAWKSIEADKDVLELSNANKQNVIDSLTLAKKAVVTKLNSAYSWVADPRIEMVDIQHSLNIVIEPLSGSDDIIPRCENKFLQDETIITKYAPARLLMDLDNILWKDSDYITITELWKCYTSYSYLPRLMNYNVLMQAIIQGVSSDDYFAIAEALNNEGGYINLRWNYTCLDFDTSELLVKKIVAEKEFQKIKKKDDVTEESDFVDKPEIPPQGPFDLPTQPIGPFGQTPISSKTKDTSFYLSHDVNTVRMTRDVGKIYDEVIAPLQSINGAKIKVTIEIQADFNPNSVDVDTKRTIEENCRTLQISDFDFEE